jgi:hypothetical protein
LPISIAPQSSDPGQIMVKPLGCLSFTCRALNHVMQSPIPN